MHGCDRATSDATCSVDVVCCAGEVFPPQVINVQPCWIVDGQTSLKMIETVCLLKGSFYLEGCWKPSLPPKRLRYIL